MRISITFYLLLLYLHWCICMYIYIRNYVCLYYINDCNCICSWNKSTNIPVPTKTIQAHFPQLWGYVHQTHIHTYLGTYIHVSMDVYMCINTEKNATRVLFPPSIPTFAPQLPAFHFVCIRKIFLHYFMPPFVDIFCSFVFVLFQFCTQNGGFCVCFAARLTACVCMYVCMYAVSSFVFSTFIPFCLPASRSVAEAVAMPAVLSRQFKNDFNISYLLA